jgi:hypothetical protein
MRRMLTLLVAISIIALAGSALAAGPLRSVEKVPPVKMSGTAGESRGLLDCSMATEVTMGVLYNGTNVGAPNNVDYYSCSSWLESGGEVVYHLYLAEPTMWEATLTPSGCDLDLAVLDQCDEDLGCQIVVDSGVYTLEPVQGDFYFVVDGYYGDACDFTFIVEEQAMPEIACDHLMQGVPGNPGDIIPMGTYVLSGNTCDSFNMIQSLLCAGWTEAGLDDWYEITLMPGGSFDFSLVHAVDSALWVVDACQDIVDANCLAYADNNYPETDEFIYYMNNTGMQQAVYLVVDSYGTDSCGEYTGTLNIYAPGVIPSEAASWGVLKSQYK